MWTHVGFVVDGSSIQFYLNGKSAYFSSSHSNYNFDGTAQIGSISTNTNASINGYMDEVRIWEKSLTTDELRLNRHITLDNGNYSGLLAYYQFNETGSQVFDKAGSYSGALKYNASISSSTAPLGGGVSELVPVSNGNDLQSFSTGVNIMFDPADYPQGDFVVTRISGHPDYAPMSGPYSNDYWIINNYTNKTNFGPLDMIRFDGIGLVTNSESNNPSQLVLMKRESNYDGNSWGSPVENADAAYSGNMGDVVFSANNNITEFSQFFISRTTILPVELLSFNVAAQANKRVLVNWTTESEIDLDRYDIERSTDGEKWEMIGYSFANGSLDKNEYEFIDHASTVGINYYRLKSVDTNGEFSYSDVQSVVITDEQNYAFEVYPNPASDHVNVIINGAKEVETMILLYNQSGQKIVEAQINQDLRLDTSKLSPGIYLLVLQNNSNRENHKLVIQ